MAQELHSYKAKALPAKPESLYLLRSDSDESDFWGKKESRVDLEES
jgi:hypothetical protein